MQKQKTGVLVLADGTIFNGISVGTTGYGCGEVVFNTAQTGYQETMTDPSYAGQIIIFTQPHIGNVGINLQDMESAKIWAAGIIMRSFSNHSAHWRAIKTLGEFLNDQRIIAISDIDTRALTCYLRQHGSQSGCLAAGDVEVAQALQKARNFAGVAGKDLTSMVSTSKRYVWQEGTIFTSPNLSSNKTCPHIAVIDFGVKHSILRRLIDYGCKVTVVPATTSAEEILTLQPDGIVLSNGPGDPDACTVAIATVKPLLNSAIPLMAICLGHQLLAIASGATTQKMKFGHHGVNHPVICLKTGKVAISSQNHGFVVADENLPACLRVTHRSLFDGTIVGLERTDVPAFGFQGHPEAGPGPTELTHLFQQFINNVRDYTCRKEPILKAS